MVPMIMIDIDILSCAEYVVLADAAMSMSTTEETKSELDNLACYSLEHSRSISIDIDQSKDQSKGMYPLIYTFPTSLAHTKIAQAEVTSEAVVFTVMMRT